MVDAIGLGPIDESHGGSIPLIRTHRQAQGKYQLINRS